MAEVQILTDEKAKINSENKNNNLVNKTLNEISPSSPAYIFCKSLDEINNKSENGWTPIYKSIMANNKLGLESLLKLGANPNIPNNLGETPLYFCVESENFELFKILIEYGADTNIQKRNGDTPLHFIIKKKLENKYINEIFKGNANPNIKNKLYEQTPTHLSLINKSSEDILINFWKNNADIYNIKDKYDKTPFDYAKESNDEKFIEKIINIFGTKNSPKKYEKEKEEKKEEKKEENNAINNNENEYKNLKENKVEKKLNFEKQTLSSKKNEKISISEKDSNISKIRQNTGSNNNLKASDIDKISSIASISKYDNEDLNSGINDKIIDLEKDPRDYNKYKINKKLNEYTKERGTGFSNSNSNFNTENEKIKENEFNLSHSNLTYNNEKYIGNKEIILTKDKNKKIFSEQKDNFNKTETRIIENDLEKITYKIFKNIKILNKKKKDLMKKPKEKNVNKNKSKNNEEKYGCINNQNNFYYESKNNIDETDKDISTINNENSFFYEGEEETINESYINNQNKINNDSNKENIDTNNLVYHNKNHLATKEKNKNHSNMEIHYKTSTNPLHQKNIKKNLKNKCFSPDFKFTYKCFNRNSLIQNEQNIFLNNAENVNNSYVYNQYRNNNIIINKNRSCFNNNKYFYEINSLNNTTFSSVKNNSRNNLRPMPNRNSITSNSFSNNSYYNNNSDKNNNTSSFIINDYYNNKYPINSYKINQNNKLIKFRDWLISCDLLCYYNTLVKNHMYNIDKYIENIRANKINIISFKDIEEFGIRKPGHIFRLLIKLQIDAGKIDYNLYKFITDKFNINTTSNNGAMTTSYNEVNCFGLNCCLSNNTNSNKKISQNNNMNENEISYYDIFSFLKMNNLLKFKENFIHNGFDQIDYILIQLFSKYTFNKKILNDYMHIYLEEDKNYILKILYREKKKICNLLGIRYNDDEIKKILYSDYINNTLNESYANSYQNNHDDCCLIF